MWFVSTYSPTRAEVKKKTNFKFDKVSKSEVPLSTSFLRLVGRQTKISGQKLLKSKMFLLKFRKSKVQNIAFHPEFICKRYFATSQSLLSWTKARNVKVQKVTPANRMAPFLVYSITNGVRVDYKRTDFLRAYKKKYPSGENPRSLHNNSCCYSRKLTR